MSSITLWIQLENKPSPMEYDIDLHKFAPHKPTLSRLAARLCQDIDALSNLASDDLEFFIGDDRTNPVDVRLPLEDVAKDIGQTPLVVRFPLSDTRVHIRYNLSTSKGSITLPHTTGLWCRLCQEVYERFEALRDGDPEFYFSQHLDGGKDGDDITDEFQLNAMVEDTLTKVKKREISLGIRIKGKKAYGDYTLKEVSKLFLKDEWNNIGNAPQFDIESLPKSTIEPKDELWKHFFKQLEDTYHVFQGKIPNEATAREFISIFMKTAIRFIQEEHKDIDLQLLVEEFLSGTRGYGLIDYLAKYLQLVVMVNEAKHRDFDQGAAQNIVQMHSALEKLNKKRKLNRTVSFAMYGIVSTAKSWVFLRWTGSIEKPLIEISKEYDCGDLVGETDKSKLILRHIIRILLSAIESVKEVAEIEENMEEEEEGIGTGLQGHEESGSNLQDNRRSKKGKYVKR